MSSEQRDVYLLRGGGDDEDEWVRPTPARTAIEEALIDRTDLDPGEIDDLDAYVDWAELSALLAGDRDEAVTFEVRGYRVTVEGSGDITVGE